MLLVADMIASSPPPGHWDAVLLTDSDVLDEQPWTCYVQ